MARISPEKEINYISRVIDKNLVYYETKLKDKGFLSENILSQLRNLVEDVAILINNKINKLQLDTHYDNVKNSFDIIKNKKDYKFLYEFHEYLQGTASHYTPNEDGAERLVKYYFRYICQIKKILKDEFDIDIIKNIDLFPIYDDKSMKDNYDRICTKIENLDPDKNKKINGKFYVEKINTIYSNGSLYYELTLSKATDYNNKFERLTFYSKEYIPDNYSVNITSVDEMVDLNVGRVKIKIITSYKTAIRACELKNLFTIFGDSRNISEKYREYQNLMEYLTMNKTNLKEIICLKDEEYNEIIEIIKTKAENHRISLMLTYIRKIIKENLNGCNVARYLIYKMRNIVIRDQIGQEPHKYMSNLFFHKKSGMFDALPYSMSLHNHNPNYYDLVKAIDVEGKDDELLYSYIKNNTESNDILYTPIDEIGYFEDIPKLIEKHNGEIRSRIPSSKSLLKLDKKFIYIEEYESNSIKIIKKLEDYSKIAQKSLNNAISFYLDLELEEDISDDKVTILNDIFKSSSIAFIYGPAGTGKTKMIEVLSKAMNNYKTCIIANTNTAVTNIKTRLDENDNLTITTIKKFINNYEGECDFLVIDECSTVNNKDMISILEKMKYKAIVMVGDIYQIESIQYGNWFKICSRYFKNGISYELEFTHRTSDEDLLKLWDCIRNNDKKAISIMTNKEYSEPLSDKIFSKSKDEEIILCLNYDGMYGINNINRVMQSNNKNKEYTFGVDTFKIDDPILFNDCPRFNGFLHNNVKGVIKNIEELDNSMLFSIEIDENSISRFLAPEDVEIIDSENIGKVIVIFKVNEYKDKDDDENEYNHIIPFNLSYAISIHKAQGLEYDSVKIVITPNIEDRITKNVFYTAITRAKKKLKVYWSPDSQDKIFECFKKDESIRDLGILNQKLKNK